MIQHQPMQHPGIQDQLVSILGTGALRVQEDGLVASPADLGEVAETLRTANTQEAIVTPYGAGTKQGWGYPDRSSLRLEMRRLNAIREHTWQDMTCTVEAGCVWSDLQQQLARHGQFVALDPLWPDRATVGGIVATNDSGSLRHKYGGLRDLVLGMTIVLADGTVARTGGKVVKNVAGYDLHKLMTGAFGTLGVIAEVSFRLHAIPKHTRSLSFAAADTTRLCELMHLLLDSQLSIQTMQLASGSEGFHLHVQLASVPEVMETQAAAISLLAQQLNLPSSAADAGVWNLRQQLFEPTGSIVIKATMLASGIGTFVTAIHAMGGRSVAQALGLAMATVPADACPGLAALRQQLEANHGSLTVLRQPSPAAMEPWGTPPDSLPLMRELKRRFDPKCILNPGRFLGGI